MHLSNASEVQHQNLLEQLQLADTTVNKSRLYPANINHSLYVLLHMFLMLCMSLVLVFVSF